jgi:hypothetical protein
VISHQARDRLQPGEDYEVVQVPVPGCVVGAITSDQSRSGKVDCAVLRPALNADPDAGHPLITSAEGLDVTPDSGSSTRSRYRPGCPNST